MDGWSGFGEVVGLWFSRDMGWRGGCWKGVGIGGSERDTAAWMKSCWEKMRDLEDKKDTATVKP